MVIRTAWTKINSERRFARCLDHMCNYFHRVDGPFCERAKMIIPELISRINALKGEVKALEMKRQTKEHQVCFTIVVHLDHNLCVFVL